MIRCALLTLASVMLRVAKPEYFRLGGKLGLSSSQLVTLHWYLKWALPLWAVLDLNSVLNRFAERRWIWKTDKSIWDWKREVAVVTGGLRWHWGLRGQEAHLSWHQGRGSGR